MARKLWLRAHFGLNAKDFDNGLSRVTRKLHQFDRSVRSIGSNLAGAFSKANVLLGAAGVGLSAGGLALGLKNAAESMDDLAKASDKIGIASEALGGLRHAADLSGVSAEQLDTAMGRLLRTIGEAKAGKKSAQDILTLAGLGPQDLNSNAVDLMSKVADRIVRIRDASSRAAITMNLFGRSGLQMVPMLQDGGKALRETAQEAIGLGVAVDRVTLRMVELANDAMSRVKTAVRGIFSQLFIQIAPFIESAAMKITNWLKSDGGVAGKVGAVAKKVGEWAGWLADKFWGFAKSAVTAIEHVLRALQSLLKGGNAAMRGLVEMTNIVGSSFDNMFVGEWGRFIKFMAKSALIPGASANATREFLTGQRFQPMPLPPEMDFAELGKGADWLKGRRAAMDKIDASEWLKAKTAGIVEGARKRAAESLKPPGLGFETLPNVFEKVEKKAKDAADKIKDVADSMRGLNGVAGTGGRLMAPVAGAFAGIAATIGGRGGGWGRRMEIPHQGVRGPGPIIGASTIHNANTRAWGGAALGRGAFAMGAGGWGATRVLGVGASPAEVAGANRAWVGTPGEAAASVAGPLKGILQVLLRMEKQGMPLRAT